jgi:hypothetical protein
MYSRVQHPIYMAGLVATFGISVFIGWAFLYAIVPALGWYQFARARRAVVDALFALTTDPRSAADVRAVADDALNRLSTRLSTATADDADDRSANAEVVRDARNWLDRRIAPPKPTGVIPLPPGTPIG